MKRGHLFAFPQTPTQLEVYYDGLLDPLQATASNQPNTPLAEALGQHLSTLVPSLTGQAVTAVETFTSWLTPDFLPALGHHPLQPALILATGWADREAAAAPAVAQQISQSFIAENVPFNPAFLPNRFTTGIWQKVSAPGSLVWQEPSSEREPPSLLSTPPEYMSNVQMVQAPTAQYAGTVRQTEKTITAAEKKPTEMRMRNAKPKIQTAGLKSK